MMLRLVLLLVLIVLMARGFWRIVDGIVEGVSGRGSSQVRDRGVSMVRDPVCGTFLLPERAVTLGDGRHRVFFCSTTCRDKYRARSA
jgi:YHS domain-containing protein